MSRARVAKLRATARYWKLGPYRSARRRYASFLPLSFAPRHLHLGISRVRWAAVRITLAYVCILANNGVTSDNAGVMSK